MIEILQNEVDANHKAFRDLLFELTLREANRWALTKNKECVDFYGMLRDAETVGRAL